MAKRTRKSTQVCRTRTCVRTCDGRPNGFASRLASSRKSQKVVNFTHTQLTCDQLVSTCVGWPSGEILASTCVRIWTRPKPTLVNASQRKWMAKRNGSRKLALTCADLRVRLASALKEGKAVPTTKTRIVRDSRPWNSDWLIHSRWYLSRMNAVMQKSARFSANLWLVVCLHLTFVGEYPTMWVFVSGAPCPPPNVLPHHLRCYAC